MKRILILFLFTFLITACSNRIDTSDVYGECFENLKAHKTQLLEMYNFNIPDSVDSKKIIATYFQSEPKAHVIICYKDSSHLIARKLSYFIQGGFESEDLFFLKMNEFKSISTGHEFVVTPTRVKIFPKSSSLSYVREEIRIDVAPQ